jgi:hypothetical protein
MGEDSAELGFELEADMKRFTSLFCGFIVLCAIVSEAWAWAGVFGTDPIGKNPEWIPGTNELADRPNRFGGYFVNAQYVFCYRGDTEELNEFLTQYAKLVGTPLVIYFHEGPKNIGLPWDDQTVKFNPDWTLYVSPKSWSMYRDKSNKSEIITRTDIWLSNIIRREDIKVPKNITIK